MIVLSLLAVRFRDSSSVVHKSS